tara:strand:- start:15226 stop:16359 length:1134 start_codon:yes stop_codon:yes gene_type:complete
MKIIQVYQTSPFKDGQGGGVRYLINLTSGLKKSCDEILFLGIGNNAEQHENIKLLPITKKLTGYIFFLLMLTLKLPFLNLKNYQAVHVHRLYFAIPFILLKPNLKIVCSLHGRTFSVFKSNYGNWKLKFVKPIFEFIERFSIKHIDFLVPVSQDVLNNFKEKYKDIEKRPLQIIGSMLNLKGFKLQNSNYFQEIFGVKNKYVLFIGRLADVKNIDFLIQLWSVKFQNQENIKLIIAGDGGDREKLKSLSNKVCLKNKPIFIGEIDPKQIPILISSSNICVLSSKHEASPTVVKESLSCGIPIITNRVGDVDDFIVNEVNGFVVRKDFESYYKAIKKLINKPLLKEDIKLESKEKLYKCSVEYVSSQYSDIYKKLMKL